MEDKEYDRKFEDMKKYIPFLENMIKRLEDTGTGVTNPRQAQLSKIKALRVLLLNKNKRMKMENLLKCEHVLINLYSKVEQKDLKTSSEAITSPQEEIQLSEEKKLNDVRQKLKSVTLQKTLADDILPDINAPSTSEVLYNKEPALFHRRSDMGSSPKAQPSTTKRNYTRVLVSPEHSPQHWNSPDSRGDQLFQRRSPKRSSRSPRRTPRRDSSPSRRKDKKKNRRDSDKSQKSPRKKDLNITLKVPSESLRSLNTEDVFDRIISCDDKDVDINTLRDLRHQIIGELQQTGVKDDISDLILKSYQKKKKKEKEKPQLEVEDGELSDSESEAIANVYGSLSLVENDKHSTKDVDQHSTSEKQNCRKIQICLSAPKMEVIKKCSNNEQTDIDDFDIAESYRNECDKRLEKTDVGDISLSTDSLIQANEFDIESKPENPLNVFDLDGNNENVITELTRIEKIKDDTSRKVYSENNVNVSNPANFYKPIDGSEFDISPDVSTNSEKIQTSTLNKDQNLELLEDPQYRNKRSNIDSSEFDIIPETGKDRVTSLIEAVHEQSKLLNADCTSNLNTISPKKQPNNAVNSEPRNTQSNYISKNTALNKAEDVRTGKVNEIDGTYKPNNEKINTQFTKTKEFSKTEDVMKDKVNKVVEPYKPQVIKANENAVLTTLNKTQDERKGKVNETFDKSYKRDATFPSKDTANASNIDPLNANEFELLSASEKNETMKIPFINDVDSSRQPEVLKENVSEIDILQALKNDILSESLPVPSVQKGTPALHQPKLTKVTNVKEIVKKKISLEEYKETKCLKKPKIFPLEPGMQKQSRGLTEKECERFNLPCELPFVEDLSDSEEETCNDNEITTDDLYSDLAPKSPDVDDKEERISTPVIIPVDPIKAPVLPTKSDVDMRSQVTSNIPPKTSEKIMDTKVREISRPVDPRVRNVDVTHTSTHVNPPGPPRTPVLGDYHSTTPNMTPNARSFQKTPTHQTFDYEHSNKKNIYAPAFSHDFEERDFYRDSQQSSSKKRDSSLQRGSTRWGDGHHPKHDHKDEYGDVEKQFGRSSRNERHALDTKDGYSRDEGCPPTPSHYFGRTECPTTPSHPFGRSEPPLTPAHPFGRSERPMSSHNLIRSDCPMTPSHPFGRSDCPPTPSHPFGRSDCPLTPSHPFGRSDCPPTPSHPFGRSDCPPTPSHPFGRADCPPTPSHPFGRTDYPTTPSHPFGRSDCPTTPIHPFGRSECPTTPLPSFGRGDPVYGTSDRIQTSSYEYSKNFGRSDNSHYHNFRRDPRQKSYDNSYTHRKYHERDTSRNSFIQQNHNRERDNRSVTREPSLGRGQRDHERNYFPREPNVPFNSHKINSSKDHNRSQFVAQTYHEVDPRRSHGDNFSEVPRTYREHRAKSVSRFAQNDEEKHVSVESTSGRGFTIDTSIKATFQDLKPKTTDDCFDARSKRASSVGRSLRETSVSRSVFEEFTPNFNKRFYTNRSNVQVARAQSVGREVMVATQENLTKENKSHPEKHGKTRDHSKTNRGNTDRGSDNAKIEQTAVKSNRDPRSRRDAFEQEVKKQDVYSPRKNPRDPRMRKESSHKHENSRHYNSRRDSSDSVDKRLGIVYTNDNIASGKVLGAGHGVKNFRIPKIKRPVEETPLPPEPEKMSTHQTVTKVETANSKPETNSQKKTQEIKQSKVKETKTKKSTRVSPVISPRKSQRLKKQVVYDSDSDDDETPLSEAKSQDKKDTISVESVQSSNEVSCTNKLGDNLSNDSFPTIGDEDMDIFSENIASDSVIDNINELIAELDDDMEQNSVRRSMSENEKNNIFDSILESLKENNCDDSSPQNYREQNEVGCTETNNISEKKEHVGTVVESDNGTHDKSVLSSQISDNMKPLDESKTDEHKTLKPATCNEDIVSTSESNKTELVLQKQNAILVTEEQQSADISSTPDSTIDCEESPAAKTDVASVETQKEMNPDVSSTHDHVKEPTPSTSNSQDKEPNADPLSSLLSLLQDKSKIKALMTMLEDQQDGNKIKKKLEKLSAIVSDDEDDNDKPTDTEKVHNSDTDKIDAETTPCIDEAHSETTETISVTPSNEPETQTVPERVEEKQSAPTKVCKSIEVPDQIEKGKDTDLISDENKDVIPTQGDVQLDEDSETLDSKLVKKVTRFTKPKKGVKKVIKKRKGVGKRKAKAAPAKSVNNAGKRVTRATKTIQETQPKKKVSRELEKLQKDIREMFISNEVLNATGIRMCRLAKIVDDDTGDTAAKQKKCAEKEDDFPSPKVVLEKMHSEEILPPKENQKAVKKKRGPKSKTKRKTELAKKRVQKLKAGTKSAYEFESDSQTETPKDTEMSSFDSASGSESESLSSSQGSIGSAELLSDVKKKKRRKSAWQTGVIRPKRKCNKNIETNTETLIDNREPVESKTVHLPDWNCFTDKTYCFTKKSTVCKCRLCEFEGEGIVHHYKTEHPHFEIPLSRMNGTIAKEAIKQSMVTNFQTIGKANVREYVCCFCSKVFADTHKELLEAFFWHVVSQHTGEYKQLCSQCKSVKKCPFMLDIPPPPKDLTGLLMGFICGKCNYTQVSLENLKNHVSLRHNDEETEVYTISLSIMKQATIEELKAQCMQDMPRMLRSLVSKQKEEPSSAPALTARSVQSKLHFESDDLSDSALDKNDSASVKLEYRDSADEIDDTIDYSEPRSAEQDHVPLEQPQDTIPTIAPAEVFEESHFKMNFLESGGKEYVCCINGGCHYKTTLLISMKKHVQIKHKLEKWNGYCCVCKLIVMPEGDHEFKECLMHLLDNHMDEFPCLEIDPPREEVVDAVAGSSDSVSTPPISYIKVRPPSELFSLSGHVTDIATHDTDNLPKIESVVSLNTDNIEAIAEQPETDDISEEVPLPVVVKYEEVQEELMKSKYGLILDSMLVEVKLVNIFKCSGRFCSFSCDSAEAALLHVSTHKKMGNIDALNCIYCSFGPCENAIDLVSHIFKEHGSCRFVCSKCFYRAVASQLVEDHYTRKHGALTGQAILEASKFTPENTNVDVVLSKEIAIPSLHCKKLFQLQCQFNSPFVSVFLKHVKEMHPTSAHICGDLFGTVPLSLMAKHLENVHGVMWYHCAYCGLGADTPEENLTHCASHHPTLIPHAYMRRLQANNKGSLPLLNTLHDAKVQPKAIPATAKCEDPTREAERSVELEKLIGHTTQMIEEMSTSVDKPEDREPPATETTSILPDDPVQHMFDESETAAATLSIIDPPQQEELISRAVTPITSPVEERGMVTPKKENIELPNLTSVINLDSDEDEPETSTHTVIDLSDDEDSNNTEKRKTSPAIATKTTEIKRYPWNVVFKCGKCHTISKNTGGMKRHYNFCYAQSELATCYYCGYSNYNKKSMAEHYKSVHAPIEKFTCGICKHVETDTNKIKEHLQLAHGHSKVMYRRVGKDPADQIVENEPARGTKRKRSSTDAPVTPTKQKRFGPEDVAKLPINQILDESVFCSLCEYSTKVRQNMVRHLNAHAERQTVPETAPVNPVPHLETNEMHFDRMTNLASSSLATRPVRPEVTAITVHIPLDIAAKYPKYVAERKRYACGARGCEYISIDEAMLRSHWDTLHSGARDYRCPHCPPRQQLDASRPLSAARILAHLHMHDVSLYACSLCSYYHHQRPVVAKHALDKHPAAAPAAEVRIVREPVVGPVAPPAPPVAPAAPTMDLKPWQCGLCAFKSMLRPEVVEHCSKNHNSKIQFKCAFCPWRTSTEENVLKHYGTKHGGRQADVFYFYYREGSLPDDPDGTPRWVRQQRNTIAAASALASASAPSPSPAPPQPAPAAAPEPGPAAAELDLSVVKTEAPEGSPPPPPPPPPSQPPPTLQQLCQMYGNVCDSNGLLYKCPLCTVTMTDTKDAMQWHLYEELKYRKWGCNICSYKAFHKIGLKEHAAQEHKGTKEVALELPTDTNIERWVAHVLDHQDKNITKKKESMMSQMNDPVRIEPKPPKPSPSIKQDNKTPPPMEDNELQQLFGSFGTAVNGMFSCPNNKCGFTTKDETTMHDHLEMELAKVRWCCSACPEKFTHYHQVQLHCKSQHEGGGARALDVPRDPALRAAWLRAALRAQRPPALAAPDPPPQPDPLLVVHYEESVPTPEGSAPNEDTELCTGKRRSRPVYLGEESDEDDKLVIDELREGRKSSAREYHCKYCDFSTRYRSSYDIHTLRHYNLKPVSCGYCGYSGQNVTIVKHQESEHPDLPRKLFKTPLPDGPPTEMFLEKGKRKPGPAKFKIDLKKPETSAEELTCLICEQSVSEKDINNHTHTFSEPQFAKKGDPVLKCCICLVLRINIQSMNEHHNISHPGKEINYAYHKLHHDSREINICCMDRCGKRFKFIKDLKAHHNRIHGSNVPLNYKSQTFSSDTSNLELVDMCEAESSGTKRKLQSMETSTAPTLKRVAKKSTTKLPRFLSVARKSTTKLPFVYYSDEESEVEGYSYYGTEPSPLSKYANVTTNMLLMNKVKPFTLNQIKQHVDISPKVYVKDIAKK